MAAPKGNQFWKLADPEFLGKPKNFPKPIDLWNACKPYFEWVDENPIIKQSTTTTAKGTFHNEEPLQKPYTWMGLYVFLGVSDLSAYKENKDYFQVITHIDNIIRNQKFEGATAGIFNANIIARDLGLVDKKEIETNSKDLSESEIDAKILAIQKKLNG
jgi:hypothetical protein